MKPMIFFIISLLSIITKSVAAPIINSVENNGIWTNSSTWNLSRLPVNGDTIIIPAGITVIVSSNINLASDDVYIRVIGVLKFTNGKLRLGANSVIEILAGATIISLGGNNNDKIEIGGVSKFSGTDLLVSGPAIANALSGSSPKGFAPTGSSVLPVKLIGFNVARLQNNFVISWSTAQELNSDYFELQRSENGSNWNSFATVNAAGNSTSIVQYNYTDRGVNSSVVYYRIKQVDIDGRINISAVRVIKNEETVADVKISNGYANNLYVHFSAPIKGQVSVKLVSLSGNIINQQLLKNPIGQQIIAVNQNLKGVYVVAVMDENGNKFTSQILL